MSVEQLVQKASAASAGTIVLTDINNSTAIPEFAGECAKNNIRPAAGIEFRSGNDLLYTGIARNNNGLRELNEFLSKCNFEKTEVPFPAPSFSDAYVIYPFTNPPGRRMYDNELTGIRIADINRLLPVASALRNQMVIMQPVTFADKDDIFIHKSLRAVDNNILLSHLKPSQCAGEDEIIISPGEIKRIFSAYPEIIKNTSNLLDDCSLAFDLESQKNKKIFSASRYDDKLLLEKLAWDGMEYRYGRHNSEARKRISHELEIIDRLGFS
jgi:DNA polymerase-3 subunit alpha